MPDVAEHDPEHDDERDNGERRRVEVPVGGRPVALDERPERLFHLDRVQQRRRLDERRARQLDRGRADLGQAFVQGGQCLGRRPADPCREAAVRNRQVGAPDELDLSFDEAPLPRPLERRDIGAPVEQGRLGRGTPAFALEASERLDFLALGRRQIAHELDDARSGERDEHLTHTGARCHNGDAAHPLRQNEVSRGHPGPPVPSSARPARPLRAQR